jgi:hypothetical protein
MNKALGKAMPEHHADALYARHFTNVPSWS